jgi:hypothetical protein
MPISKKRFSKKRVKKSIKKNTRNHKKRTPRRKHRKSGKRSRFFGGSGFNDDIELGDSEFGDRSERLNLNPYPNPVVLSEHLYRLQFFKFEKDLETGEPNKVAVNLHNIPQEEIDALANYFMRKIPGLTSDNILFYGYSNHPYGYIDLDLDKIYNKVKIHEGDMAVDIDPPLMSNIQSVTITKVPNFDV